MVVANVWLQVVARTCGGRWRSLGTHWFGYASACSGYEKIKSFGGEKDDNDNDNGTLSEGPPTNVRNLALWT